MSSLQLSLPHSLMQTPYITHQHPEKQLVLCFYCCRLSLHSAAACHHALHIYISAFDSFFNLCFFAKVYCRKLCIIVCCVYVYVFFLSPIFIILFFFVFIRFLPVVTQKQDLRVQYRFNTYQIQTFSNHEDSTSCSDPCIL